MIALIAALAVTALLALQPWSSSTVVAPQLGLGRGLGVGLDDAVALPSGPSLAVSQARPAGLGKQSLAAHRTQGASGGSPAALGVAPARVVSTGTPAGAPDAPLAPTVPGSEPGSTAPPSPQPAAIPVAAPTPAPQPAPADSSPSKPTASGGAVPARPGIASAPMPMYRSAGEPIELNDGDELALSFFFYIEPIAYRTPGEENIVLRLGDELGGPPRLGLQLWDDGDAQRGLWSSGTAVDAERFLAPVSEGQWHQVVIYLKASSDDDGFYLLLLDGEPIDARGWISLIDAEGGSAELGVGLFRDGARVLDARDVFFGPTLAGESLEAVVG